MRSTREGEVTPTSKRENLKRWQKLQQNTKTRKIKNKTNKEKEAYLKGKKQKEQIEKKKTTQIRT